MHLNGYIDDEAWFGDEITPEALHGMLYPEGEEAHGDLRIFLNSYGGSCNAAVRMFDDLRAYPDSVHIIVSGTAASAATVLAMAADRLEMTPGSLWMIHDPGVMVWATSGIWRRPSDCSGRARRASSTSTADDAENPGTRSAP